MIIGCGGADQKEYADFRNKKAEDFWTDPRLISDYEKTVEFIINRKNTFTNNFYKDDKAILAWETGNELHAPFSWTSQISIYIKTLDKNHLIIDGTAYHIIPEETI